MDFFRQTADAFLGHHEPLASTEEAVVAQAPKDEVQDPEMDAAIAEMKERLENLRAKNALQRIKNQKEINQLKARHEKESQRVKDAVSTMQQRAHFAPYLAATKRVQDDIQTGVVATLQAQLCLHLHGVCVHSEQIHQLKSDSSEIMFWYEHMVRQLRREKPEEEMRLINEIVHSKIRIEELTDAKKLRERQEQRAPTSRSLSRKFSRTISHTKSGSLKRYHSKRGGELSIRRIGSRQRTIRRISTREKGSRERSHSSGSNPLSGSRVPRMASASVPETMCALMTKRVTSTRPIQAVSDDEETNEGNVAMPGLKPPSETITARRAARAEARRAGRPVQRSRSRSLTDLRRRRQSLHQHHSQDDNNERRASQRRISTKELLVAFPQRAQDDSSTMTTTRRASTHALLRGFSPLPNALPATSIALANTATQYETEGFTSTFRTWMGAITVRT